MRPLYPVRFAVMLCLPACRHGDSYSGGGLGPLLTPSSGSAIGFGTAPDTMEEENAHPQGDEQRPPRSAQTQTKTEDNTPAPTRGHVSTRNSTTGSERGLTGAENVPASLNRPSMSRLSSVRTSARVDDELLKLRGKTDGVSNHHRQTFKEQKAAAQKLEKAAKVKPVNATLMRRHEFAGGKLSLPKSLHKKYGTHLPFTVDGFPDFTKFVRKEVKIKVQGRHGIDSRLADKAAGFTTGRPKNWTWHHHQDGTTMQLVPYDLHKRVGHSGSYSIYRAERGLK